MNNDEIEELVSNIFSHGCLDWITNSYISTLDRFDFVTQIPMGDGFVNRVIDPKGRERYIGMHGGEDKAKKAAMLLLGYKNPKIGYGDN